MEGLLVHKITINSIRCKYTVNFTNSWKDRLLKEYKKGDIIIIDKNIIKYNLDYISTIANKCTFIEVNAHEDLKSYLGVVPIINKLIEYGFRRSSKIIGIGGGVTQDVTAFIASIMYRGVDWIFFPTTLLAQGDSCIGSKTSINFGKYKNQLGGFYPPNKIFIDLSFLKTLSKTDIKSGLGEICHYYIASGITDFKKLEKYYNNSLNNSTEMEDVIYNSLLIKKRYIEIDELDKNKRQIFNYGHTFGHAIETLTNYAIPHGIAISFGMDIANYISYKLGYLKSEIRYDIRALLKKFWTGYDISKIDIKEFCDVLAKDKKNTNKDYQLILCRGYGKLFKQKVKRNIKFRTWLQEYLLNELN